MEFVLFLGLKENKQISSLGHPTISPPPLGQCLARQFHLGTELAHTQHGSAKKSSLNSDCAMRLSHLFPSVHQTQQLLCKSILLIQNFFIKKCSKVRHNAGQWESVKFWSRLDGVDIVDQIQNG